MKKLAIYTCVCGPYDGVAENPACCQWADYYYFSREERKEGRWQWKPLQFDAGDDVKTARWHKLHPHLLFPEYEYSLWLDGNIGIKSNEFFCIVEKQINDNVLYSGIPHPYRDDVFEESVYILRGGRERAGKLLDTVRFLSNEGMPEHWGLDETGIILRKHNSEDVIKADELWWKTLDRFTSRDQMSWSYSMWKTGLAHTHLIGNGVDIRTSSLISYSPHRSGISRGKDYFKCFKSLRKGIITLWYRYKMNVIRK